MSSTALLLASTSPPPSRGPEYAALDCHESSLAHAIDMGVKVSAAESAAAAGGAYVTASSSCGASSAARLKHNPFTYTTPVDAYEKLKMVALCLLGVPLVRVLLLLSVGVLLVIVSHVALLGYKPLDAHTGARPPLPRWRRVVGAPVPYLLRSLMLLVGYYWVPVKYPPNFDRRTMPRVIVSNHVTFFDGLYIFTLLSPSIAMKTDVADLPLVSRVVQMIQPILIDRGTPEGRKRAMNDITAHVADPSKPPLLVFPEGTTSNQLALTKFKVGSFVSGVPCQPIVLRYPFKHFDMSWPPGVSGLYLALRVLCQVYNRLEVEILPAYYPSEREQNDPQLYANNVRDVMATALGIPTTNHAFEDVAMLMRIGDYATKHVVPLTDVGEVISLTALKRGDVDRLVEYFRRRDLDKDGQLSMEELRALFPSDDPVLVDQLFDLVDVDDSGLVDFRELCLALRALNPQSVNEGDDALAKFAFRLYDLDNNGLIDAAELEQMLRFQRSFYGVPEASVAAALRQASHAQAENGTAGVTFKRFEHLVEQNPELLGYVRTKLEVLRGSLRESSSLDLLRRP
ncbi:Lysophosphatidylcholine acyltransferase 2 [Phytophthora pseudosyringae]|uniref:Lysophosphatidylcholine acyltransferase 2 n=1 Tax=Phytophthora pseudosyringae TaxID=221518 RepID=A0A8T1VD50_9STRA|nr:Lysophosphatidylcholine acyltransferase 2 [Phytophthora pseudosyringae]